MDAMMGNMAAMMGSRARPAMAAGPGMMGGGIGQPNQAGASIDGGQGGDGTGTRNRRTHPADLERNKAIEEALEKIVPMNFPSETPLEEVLKHLKTQLTGRGGKPIPIYVDPLGLQEAEKTLASPVTIDLDDLPIRTTLRLVLNQLGMVYLVRDGMLTITSESRDPSLEGAEPANRRKPAPASGNGGLQ